MLNNLPLSNRLRNIPVNGAWMRQAILLPHEATDSDEIRKDKEARRGYNERIWTPWKQVKNWKIASKSFNELGRVWTDYSEWTFENPKK